MAGLVDHEIVSVYLEAEFAVVLVKFAMGCVQGEGHVLVDLGFALVEVQGVGLHYLFQLFEGHLVAVGYFAVIGGEFLHCVVGQMHEGAIFGVLGTVFEGTETDIALGEHIAFHIVGDQHPHADVEFVVVDQKWSLQVFLDEETVGFYYCRYIRYHANELVAIEYLLVICLPS